ncbi:unnamed protein product [Rhizophagus irregularis]|nr:unnamed protein product [Rhizophagus irregularis]
MDNREREDTIHKGKCRDIMDRITESIRYRQQPKMKEKGLRIIIVVIVRDCIEGNLENEVFDRLIGNPELMEHGYILEDWDVENRFQKFWEWYDTILEYDMRVGHILPEAMVEFRKFLYMEESIAEVDRHVMFNFVASIGYKNIPYRGRPGEEHRQMWDRYGQKIKQRFIDTRQFTKEPEDSESDDAKNSPESYEFEEGVSDEYEVKLEDDIEWTVELLKRKIEEMGGKFSDKDIQKIWDLQIRMELILTDEFLGTVWEVINLSNERLKYEVNEWLAKETIICEDCGNRKLPHMMNENTNQCKNCKQKELLELKDDLEKLGYELDVSEIRRIKELRISDSVMLTVEFMEKYFQEIELDDKELRIKLYEWVNENTTFCNECGIRWINNKFDEGKTKCKDCENDEMKLTLESKD